MNCQRYANQIKDLVENKLDEQAAEQITLHLIECQNCEAEFENLRDSKEAFANLLFGIEPPTDLAAKFQAKLETAENKVFAVNESSVGWFEKLLNAFAFFRLNRALATAFAFALFALGFGFFHSSQEKETAVNNPPPSNISKTETAETEKSKFVSIDEESKKIEAVRIKKVEIPQLKKETAQTIAVKRLTEKKSATKPKISAPKKFELSAEEENQIAQVQSFETDAAKQFEKTEILFRAFRNIRPSEETGQFDVDYEKQQSRKLLQHNAQLKQRAENYGNLLAEETLNKIEPFLLEIANLDSNPSAEQMSEIKDRFKSQEIIASLQGF